MTCRFHYSRLLLLHFLSFCRHIAGLHDVLQEKEGSRSVCSDSSERRILQFLAGHEVLHSFRDKSERRKRITWAQLHESCAFLLLGNENCVRWVWRLSLTQLVRSRFHHKMYPSHHNTLNMSAGLIFRQNGRFACTHHRNVCGVFALLPVRFSGIKYLYDRLGVWRYCRIIDC